MAACSPVSSLALLFIVAMTIVSRWCFPCLLLLSMAPSLRKCGVLKRRGPIGGTTWRTRYGARILLFALPHISYRSVSRSKASTYPKHTRYPWRLPHPPYPMHSCRQQHHLSDRHASGNQCAQTTLVMLRRVSEPSSIMMGLFSTAREDEVVVGNSGGSSAHTSSKT